MYNDLLFVLVSLIVNEGRKLQVKLFSNDFVNAGRQIELDWAKGLAVIFMIFVHLHISLSEMPLAEIPWSEPYYQVVMFCGGPLAAPTFMILLGVGIVYSRNRNPQKLAMRGLKLVLLHYGLNFTAFGVPSLVMYSQTQNAEYLGDFFTRTFGVDILAFAGLTFLFFALKEKLRLNIAQVLLVVFACSCLNYLLTMPMDEDYLYFGLAAGLFVRVTEYSYFPFVSWIAYPVIGYVFGDLLKRCTDKATLYRYLFLFAALTVAAMTLGAKKYGFDLWWAYIVPDEEMIVGGMNDYYFQDFLQYIQVGGICFAWFGLLYALSCTKVAHLIGTHLARWSKNVTIIYCVHWLILGWLSILELLPHTTNTFIHFMMAIALVICSDLIASLYVKVSTTFLRRE